MKPLEENKCECDVLPHHCKALFKRNIPTHRSNNKNVTEETKSTRQNTTSHVTVKQYMKGDMHSDRDAEMLQAVDAPQKKKQKNNNGVQEKNKMETMMSKVSKVSPKTVQQQHIYVKRDNAYCTSS